MKKHLLFLLPLAMPGACQTKSNNETLSKTQSFGATPEHTSPLEGNVQYKVLAIPNDKKEICVVKMGPKVNDPILELWTPKGPITEAGLRRSLKYSKYSEHFLIGFLSDLFKHAGKIGILVASTSTYVHGEGQSEESRLGMSGTSAITTAAPIPAPFRALFIHWVPERILRGKRAATATSQVNVHPVPETQLMKWKTELEKEAPINSTGCKGFEPPPL